MKRHVWETMEPSNWDNGWHWQCTRCKVVIRGPFSIGSPEQMDFWITGKFANQGVSLDCNEQILKEVLLK